MVAALKSSFQQRNDVTPGEQASPSETQARERAEALGREMFELTAHISAAEARFFELLAEFDRDELWRCSGCHSAAHWLTWQCGFGEVAARERVRVARALDALPKISAAFRRGEVSYSKVRELTRVARPESENALLEVALHGTAAHVQKVVARHSRAERLLASADAVEQFRQRYVRYRHDDDGTVVIEARLPAEIGEVVMRAIDAAVEVLYRQAAERECEASESRANVVSGGDDGRAQQTDSHVVNADVPAGTSACADDGAIALQQTETAATSADNLEPTELRNVPAGTQGDVSAGTQSDVSAETQARRTSEGLPGLILAPSSSALESSRGMREPLAARRADALRLLAENFLSAPDGGRVDTSADRYQVVVHISQALLSGAHESEQPRSGSFHIGSGRSPLVSCELDDGRVLAIETARRLACDATLVGIIEDGNGEPLNVGRRTRAISPALRRALRARDGGCRFPGCGHSRFTHAHHVVPWAKGGETSLRNLLTLCTFHHMLVHEGGYSIERFDDGSFAFFSPDGERLPETGRLDPRLRETLRRAADIGEVTLRELSPIGLGATQH